MLEFQIGSRVASCQFFCDSYKPMLEFQIGSRVASCRIVFMSLASPCLNFRSAAELRPADFKCFTLASLCLNFRSAVELCPVDIPKDSAAVPGRVHHVPSGEVVMWNSIAYSLQSAFDVCFLKVARCLAPHGFQHCLTQWHHGQRSSW